MTLFQAYPTRAPLMQPVTKIRIFRIRLAIVLLALYWLAMFTGTHLPRVDFVQLHVGDKVKHFVGFFGLAFLLCYVTGGRRVITRFSRVAAIVLAYAAFDEWSQGFVPGRTPDRYDFLADAAGMLAAMAMYLVAKFLFGHQIRGLIRKIRGQSSDWSTPVTKSAGASTSPSV
ncbi:VanZ family protein [Crateriforma conspicua]|nr:VanZ family protein [Crateriforma conspicua]